MPGRRGLEIGEACGMYDCRRETVTGFWCGNFKERGHLEDLRVDGG